MRKIARTSIETPTSLLGPAAINAYDEIAKAVSADRVSFERRISVNHEIYSASDVQRALLKLFSEKCAYCEQSVHDVSIDHFRPIGAAADQDERKTSLHHYSWLAYDWRNLYLVCRECNASKRNRFPVIGPRLPLLVPLDEANAREAPLLLNPCEDDPTKSLEFNLDGVCFGRDKVGKVTIDVLNLNGDALVKSRSLAFRKYLDQIHSRSSDTKDKVFDVSLPHIGAFEIFARRSVAALARFLDLDIPTRARELDFFVKHLQDLSRSDFSKVIRNTVPSNGVAMGDAVDLNVMQRHVSIEKFRFERRISSVQIENFKGIDNLELRFPEVGGSVAQIG